MGLSLGIACDGRGAGSPLPGGAPNTGGETGDPGVYGPIEHTVDPVDERGDSSGSCTAPSQTSVAGDAAGRDRGAGSDVVLAELPDGRLATADRAFGLVLVEDPKSAPKPGPARLLDDDPVALYPLENGRLALVLRGSVALYDVGGEQAVALASRRFQGNARDSVLVTGDGGHAVFVVTDGLTFENNICGTRAQSYLHGVAVDGDATEEDGLGTLQEVALGRDVSAALLTSARVVVAHLPQGIDPDATPQDRRRFWEVELVGPTELQLLTLSANGTPEDHGVISALPAVVTRAAQLQLDGHELQVVSIDPPGDPETAGEDGWANDQPAGRLDRLSLADLEAEPSLGHCTFEWKPLFTPASYYTRREAKLVHLSDGVALVDEAPDHWQPSESHVPPSGRVVQFADAGTCPTAELALPYPLDTAPRLRGVGGDRLLAIGRAEADSEALELRLYDQASPSEALAALVLTDARVDESSEIRERVFVDAPLPAGTGDEGPTLVSVTVGKWEANDPLRPRPGSALVAVTNAELADLGRLPLMLDTAVVADSAYTMGAGRLRSLIVEDDRVVTDAALGVWPNAGGPVAPLPTAVAELSWDWDDDTTRVELLAPDAPVRTVLSTIEAGDRTNVFAIDEHLVVMQAETGCAPTGAARLRVFDVSDPADPVQIGELTTDALDPCRHYGADGEEGSRRAPAVGGRLVLRRSHAGVPPEAGEPLFTPTQNYSFHVIDITDPSAPQVTELARPQRELGYDSWVQDGTLYYSFAVDVGEDSAKLAPFLATLDLEASGPLAFTEFRNVPGDAFLVDGDTIYTRAGSGSGDDVEYRLQRTTVDGSNLTIDATLEMGLERATSGRMIGERLFVTAGPPTRLHYGWKTESPTRLMVLRPDDLSLVGELPLAERAVILGGLEGRLVVGSSRGTLQLVDIADPTAPAILAERTAAVEPALRDQEVLYRHHAPGPLVRWQLDLDVAKK